MTQPTPNFFIAGAPKCGTTSMYAYLSQHPDIFMPDMKEPHYFATDLSYRGYVRERDTYYELFSSGTRCSRSGEASVWYLYSQAAAANIQAELGAVKILIMLRNPVDMLYSLHSQFLVSGTEDTADFVTALNAESDRRAGQRLPRTDYDLKLLRYSDVVDFAPQVQRYIDIFGREQLHFVFFEDLQRDTDHEVRRCLEFLDIDASFQPSLDVVNRNKKVRNLALQSLLRRPSSTVRRIARTVVPTPVRQQLVRRLMRANTYERRRAPLDSKLRLQLSKRFRPQVERLSALLDRDLSSWLAPSPANSAA